MARETFFMNVCKCPFNPFYPLARITRHHRPPAADATYSPRDTCVIARRARWHCGLVRRSNPLAMECEHGTSTPSATQWRSIHGLFAIHIASFVLLIV